MVRLSKEEWRKLDDLLEKIGFGGYYDLIGVLRMTVSNLKPELRDKVEKESDLETLVMLIHRLSYQK